MPQGGMDVKLGFCAGKFDGLGKKLGSGLHLGESCQLHKSPQEIQRKIRFLK